MNEANITVSSSLIKQTVSQIEKLEADKLEINSMIKEVFDNARAHGLEITVLKQLIKMRKKKQEDLAMEEELLEIYRRALEQ